MKDFLLEVIAPAFLTCALIFGTAVGLVLFTAPAANGIDISPAACYAFHGEYVSKLGLHSALIMNTCTGELKWEKFPTPPESEV